MKKIWAVVWGVLWITACSKHSAEPERAPNESSTQESNLVEMGIEAQRHVGLQVAPAALTQLTDYLQVVGTVQPIDSRIGHVRLLGRGRVEEVLAKVGDRVKKAQPLARFDNIEAGELVAQYHSAQAEMERLKVQHTTALRQAERDRRLVEIGAAAQKDAEASQGGERSLKAAIQAQESQISGLANRLRRFGMDQPDAPGSSLTTIRSPFSGVVIRAGIAPGELVEAESDLFHVADLSKVWVQAEVYEKDLGQIRTGQTAIISVDTYPNETFSGKVTYVGDILNPQTRTVQVRCEAPNPEMKLKLDMFATVSLPTKFSRTGLVVPASAIQQVEGKDVIFVRKRDTAFEPRQVKVGKTVSGRTEVISGLTEGEQVVIDGGFNLKSIALGREAGEEE